MPGIVMHLAHGSEIINRWSKERDLLSKEWEEAFLLGTILPDVKPTKDKMVSHFWNPAYMNCMVKYPDIGKFINKYQNQLNEPMILGYLSHLLLDEQYVNVYWPTVLKFLDGEKCEEVIRSKIKWVYLKVSQEYIPIDDFLTEQYCYGDYSIMDSLFINKFHIKFPEYHNEYDDKYHSKIEEVEISDVSQLLKELRTKLDGAHLYQDRKTKIFKTEEMEALIVHCADIFVQKFPYNKIVGG